MPPEALLFQTGCLAIVQADAALLSTFDVDAMPPEALLFQTGYLTIVDEERDHGRVQGGRAFRAGRRAGPACRRAAMPTSTARRAARST